MNALPANRPFAYGDKVLLIDNKQRRYLIDLAEGAEVGLELAPESFRVLPN